MLIQNFLGKSIKKEGKKIYLKLLQGKLMLKENQS